jgi:hypothetical protein
MKVLVDHHHGALLRSMYHLFNKRLGFEIVLPSDFDWLDKGGLYSCYPNRATADQMLNSWKFNEHKNMFKEMTFQEFIDSDSVDIVVASLWENHSIFDNIIKKYNKKCKLILQAGNNILREHVQMTNAKNLLSSAYPTFVTTPDINKVFYHQEFDLSKFFPKKAKNIKSIANFKHIMEDDFNLILSLEKELPDWEFKCYGAHNRDGFVDDDESKMSDAINQFGFVFHVKKDEGYGHVIHNAFACGKPMVVDLNTAGVVRDGRFIPNTASFLFDKNKTVIDSNNELKDLVYNLKHMADKYDVYSNIIYNKFKEVVDFEKESYNVKMFLERLL